jgi:hypothetical protein
MARQKGHRQRHRGLPGLGDLEVPGIVKWGVALGVGWWALNKWVDGLKATPVTTVGTEQPPPGAS